jgi:uncharacterized damage-inducible protein DinB
MFKYRNSFLAITITVIGAGALNAQSEPTDIRDELLMQFNGSARKMVALSEAMPAELYNWSPQPGVMSVAAVFAHIAHYNFMYPEDALGTPAPHGVDMDGMEDLTDKAQITALMRQSVEHARGVMQGMTDEDAASQTRLYGRDIAQWAVLVQLVAHMNEHVGQSVAYARMNGIVPPWSM